MINPHHSDHAIIIIITASNELEAIERNPFFSFTFSHDHSHCQLQPPASSTLTAATIATSA
jgi:hypothetical protein